MEHILGVCVLIQNQVFKKDKKQISFFFGALRNVLTVDATKGVRGAKKRKKKKKKKEKKKKEKRVDLAQVITGTIPTLYRKIT